MLFPYVILQLLVEVTALGIPLLGHGEQSLSLAFFFPQLPESPRIRMFSVAGSPKDCSGTHSNSRFGAFRASCRSVSRVRQVGMGMAGQVVSFFGMIGFPAATPGREVR